MRNALSTIAWVVCMNGVIALGAVLAFVLCIWLGRS